MKITNESDGFPVSELTDLGGDPDLPEGSTPEPDCCDDDPQPIDRAEDVGHSYVFSEPVVGDGSLVQVDFGTSALSTVAATLPSAITAGNTVFVWITVRADHGDIGSDLDDQGFSFVGRGDSQPGQNGGTSELWYKVATGAEGDTISVHFGSAQGRRITVEEHEGSWTLEDFLTEGTEVGSPSSGSIGPLTTTGGLLISGLQQKRDVGAVGDVTLGDSFTETDDGGVADASAKPNHTLGYRLVAAGSYSTSWSTGVALSGWAGVFASFTIPSEGEWVPGAEEAIDGDDATCVEIDGPNVVRVTFDLPVEITNIRLLFATIPAGAKTYILKAWSEPDESDIATVATLNFTASGTDDEVLYTFPDPVTAAFWELTGPDEVRELCTFELTWSASTGGGAAVAVSEDGTPVTTAATELDFQHGLDVTDAGGGVVEIDVDESELTHNSLGGLTTGDPHTQYRLESDNHTHASSGAQGGTVDHGALTGLTDDDHTQYLRTTLGGRGTVNTVASTGASEAIDASLGNVHDFTLTSAVVTLTLTNPPASGTDCTLTVWLRQDGGGNRTVTWPGSVAWQGGSAPVLQTAAGAIDIVILETVDGGTNWLGAAGADSSVSGHVADPTDAHDASAISILDTADYFASTDVEGALAEIGAGGIGGGGEDTSLVIVTAPGATETVDCASARTYHLLLDASCVITLTGPVILESHKVTILLQQDGSGSHTVTWPAEVYWPAGVAPTLATTAGYTDWVDLITADGGDTWLGVLNGGAYHTPVPATGGGDGGTFPLVWLNSNL